MTQIGAPIKIEKERKKGNPDAAPNPYTPSVKPIPVEIPKREKPIPVQIPERKEETVTR